MSDGLLHVPTEFCRNAGTAEDLRSEETSINTAVRLIDHMCSDLGLRSMDGLDVLDFGCGVRFAQAIVNRGLPVNRYVGVDVFREMIEFLAVNVNDPRLAFAHLDAHNALYNTTGRPLAEIANDLPIEGQQFDLICLFSVFTHLAPHDYVEMLRMLRRFARPEARLFFTLFIDERTDGGHGLMDKFATALGASTDPDVKRAMTRRIAAGEKRQAPPFRDLDPKKPLLYALYSREHALELILGTGWEVVSVLPPDVHLQHHIICAPA